MENVFSKLIGKHVIIRTYSAGVHFGVLREVDGKSVLLKKSRRIWNYKTFKGVALNGIAAHGIAPGCKIDEVVDYMGLTEAIEIILCSENAVENILAYPSFKPED